MTGLLCFSVASAQELANSLAAACPQPAIGPILPPAPDRSGAPIIMYAKQLSANYGEQAQASGHVELFRADQRAVMLAMVPSEHKVPR